MLDFFSFPFESLDARAAAEAPLAAAAEFPNDNTRLHRGVRWLCLDPRGAARAVWRWSGDAALPSPSLPLAAPSPASSAAPSASGAQHPAVVLAHEPELPRVMDIDPGRVILRNRVEDVPPPPEFVFKPFRRSAPTPPLAALPAPIAVGASSPRAANERLRREIRRDAGVDIAPCIAIGGIVSEASPSATTTGAAPSRRSAGEHPRARRAAPSRRGLAVCPLPEPEELRQAILELESAFGERAASAVVL